MELTKEEKKAVVEAAYAMATALCESKLAEDRIQTMNALSGSLLKMGLDKAAVEAAVLPYMQQFVETRKNLFEVLGVTEAEEEEWNKEIEEKNAKEAKK